MRFGTVPISDAEGAVLAHSLRFGKGRSFKKGKILSAQDIAILREAGVQQVVAARLEPDDRDEDDAALILAHAAAGAGVAVQDPFTGRSNLFSTADGLLVVEGDLIDRANTVDPAITLATLKQYERVSEGRMIATVKIIPYAVPGHLVDEAVQVLSTGEAVRVAPFRPKRIAMIATTLPGTKPGVLDKTRRVLEERLEGTGSTIIAEERVQHDETAIADALARLAEKADLFIVFGASAIADGADVVPAAIEKAGGSVLHFGMPVDPGNLLLLAELGAKTVIGAPGCARSPKENGFDWVLERALADIPVTSRDITGMGVGGLLMEIVSRPQPRSAPLEAPQGVAAIVLAAGRSSRMGDENKLLLDYKGEPMIRHAVRAAIESKASPVIVVTGHQNASVMAALEGFNVTFVHNAAYADGMATSLVAGLNAVKDTVSGILVHLGDMPLVAATDMDAMIEALDEEADRLIITRSAGGRRGNPVIFHRRFFAELLALTGDEGGRQIIGKHRDLVFEIPASENALFDVDTPERYAELKQIDSFTRV